MRRSVSTHVVGMLGNVWADGSAGSARASCGQVLHALDLTATLPVATRELAERLVLSQP